MKALKIGLLVSTILVTLLLFSISGMLFLEEKKFQGAVSTFFFLACASAFSIYFHVKTLTYYPLFIFGKNIEELSKKYWALHIAFGLINLLLGIGLLFATPFAKGEIIRTVWHVFTIFIAFFGMMTLWEAFVLNRFVQIYKRRKAQHRKIEEIQGMQE